MEPNVFSWTLSYSLTTKKILIFVTTQNYATGDSSLTAGLPAQSPKNYKGSKVLFRKNKGEIKVQRGQIYDTKPRMSGIYSALEWSIQTPVTVLTYWTIKIFDLYQWAYDNKVYLKECCISHRANNNDFYLLKPSTNNKRSFPGKNARQNHDNAHFLDKMQKIQVQMWK